MEGIGFENLSGHAPHSYHPHRFPDRSEFGKLLMPALTDTPRGVALAIGLEDSPASFTYQDAWKNGTDHAPPLGVSVSDIIQALSNGSQTANRWG